MIYKDAKVLAQMLYSFSMFALQCDGPVLRGADAPVQVAHDKRGQCQQILGLFQYGESTDLCGNECVWAMSFKQVNTKCHP